MVAGTEGTRRPAAVAAKPSYGIDAPSVVMLFVGLTIASAFGGVFVGSAVGLAGGVPFWITAVCCGVTAGAMFNSSLRGKFVLWSEVFEGLGLRGGEKTLDVGCGRGLVLIETARRLTSGSATGIDLWRGRDQSGNSRAVAELNARIAKVDDRVRIDDGDMRRLPYPDGSFDLVTASLSVHNLASASDRAATIREITRVLATGGRVAIVDIAKTADYAAILEELGLLAIERSTRRWLTYPPSRVVTARKAPA